MCIVNVYPLSLRLLWPTMNDGTKFDCYWTKLGLYWHFDSTSEKLSESPGGVNCHCPWLPLMVHLTQLGHHMTMPQASIVSAQRRLVTDVMSCDRCGPAAGLNCIPIMLSPRGQEGTAQVQLVRDQELEILAVWDRSLQQ